MEVVQLMVGKWKMVPELTENQSAYMDAMELPADMKAAMMKETEVFNTVAINGDVITMETTFGKANEVMTFILGQTLKVVIFGAETENTFIVEGDVLIGKHLIAGIVNMTRKYLQDGKMIAETEAKGVVMKTVFEKC